MYRTVYFSNAEELSSFLNNQEIKREDIIHIENIGVYNWVLIYYRR